MCDHPCQHDPCDQNADFRIYDTLDTDPYTCEIFSCTAHVGEFLSHALHVDLEGDDVQEEWRIFPMKVIAASAKT